MDLASRHGLKPLRKYLVETLSRRSVIEQEWRLPGLKAEIHVNGVPLSRPDEGAILRDREPALLVLFDDRYQLLA